MKILFLTNNFPPQSGGISRFAVNICRQLGARGNKVDVLSIVDRVSDIPQKDASYRIINCKRPAWFSSLPVILRTIILAKNRYDLFFMGDLQTTGVLGMYLVSRIFKVPYIILLHGFDMEYLKSRFFFDRFLARLYLKHAKLILVNSLATKQRAMSNGIVPSRIKVLNPGVDANYFKKKESVKSYQDKFKLNGKRVVLTVSRLVERKGHKYVIEAVAMLKNEIPNIHYLIVGNGPEKNKLVEYVHRIGVSDKVSFVDPAQDDELPYYYSLAEVFVMPALAEGNDYEGFGMVYLEANACGLPVIGFKSGGVEDAIIDGETGVLVKEKDVQGLSGAIKQLLQDNAMRVKMGEAGRKRAEKLFSWQAIGDRLGDYLYNVR